MKQTIAISLAVVYALMLAGPVPAQESLVGVKTGSMMIDLSGVDDVIPIGFLYGRSLDDWVPNLWVEGELNYGISGGDVGTRGELDIFTLAVYAAYRYMPTETVYLKGKAGVLYEDVELDSGRRGSVSDSESGFSFGVGGGVFVTPQLAVEVGFTVIESDVNYLSAGLNYRF